MTQRAAKVPAVNGCAYIPVGAPMNDVGLNELPAPLGWLAWRAMHRISFQRGAGGAIVTLGDVASRTSGK